MPPRPTVRQIVTVPARNEARTITRTLTALARQTDDAGRPLDPAMLEVLLLANNCTDDTAQVARRAAARFCTLTLHVAEVQLPPDEAHVGTARRILMDAAAERLCALDRPDGLICTTDADTRVFPTWLHFMRQEARAGADAVCGRILVERNGERCDPARGLHVQDTAYRLLLAELEGWVDAPPGDPVPRHFQHFGASLAVTARAYCRVGGVPPLPFLEDVALYDALMGEGLRVRHSPAVRVVTSGRRRGRTELGLSTQLTEWEAMARAGQSLLVDAPEAWEARCRLRGEMRRTVPPALFAQAWAREVSALPPLPTCEAREAICWLRGRLRVLRGA